MTDELLTLVRAYRALFQELKIDAAWQARKATLQHIIDSFDKLDLYAIMDALIFTGSAPDIISDTTYGYAVVNHSWVEVIDDEEVEIVNHVERGEWFTSIKEALLSYLLKELEA